MRRTYLLAGSMAILAACTAYPTVSKFDGNLSDDVALGGGSYDSGGGITVAASLQERNNMTAVCGVWAQSDEQSVLTKNLARNVVASGVVSVNNKAVVRGLSFMREVPPAADYSGIPANCQVTTMPWQDVSADQISVRIPRQVVALELDEFSGGIVVVFRPDGPGAGAR